MIATSFLTHAEYVKFTSFALLNYVQVHTLVIVENILYIKIPIAFLIMNANLSKNPI